LPALPPALQILIFSYNSNGVIKTVSTQPVRFV
jgi:hypothetical protein